MMAMDPEQCLSPKTLAYNEDSFFPINEAEQQIPQKKYIFPKLRDSNPDSIYSNLNNKSPENPGTRVQTPLKGASKNSYSELVKELLSNQSSNETIALYKNTRFNNQQYSSPLVKSRSTDSLVPSTSNKARINIGSFLPPNADPLFSNEAKPAHELADLIKSSKNTLTSQTPPNNAFANKASFLKAKKYNARISNILPAPNNTDLLGDVDKMLNSMFGDVFLSEKTTSRILVSQQRLSKTRSCLFLNEYLRSEPDQPDSRTFESSSSPAPPPPVTLNPEEEELIHNDVHNFLNNMESSWLADSSLSDLSKSLQVAKDSSTSTTTSRPSCSNLLDKRFSFSSNSHDLAHHTNANQSPVPKNNALQQTPTLQYSVPVISPPKRSYFLQKKSASLEINNPPENSYPPQSQNPSLLSKLKNSTFASAILSCVKL
ncbi:hypothetical protein BB560_005507 [Smittium megazygosporum]|uniref:Uncharacterized protein n=1 Tax=Smittium megazygosporum TaxID=133381 RepID=A0A2T9Z484_9FUNG|nr:hypothetical protein BB560_005507 [Smittium megazygosporum]